jgi:hypothetical protein
MGNFLGSVCSHSVPEADCCRMARELGYSTRDIMKMYKFFNYCDVNNSGTVTIEGNLVSPQKIRLFSFHFLNYTILTHIFLQK